MCTSYPIEIVFKLCVGLSCQYNRPIRCLELQMKYCIILVNSVLVCQERIN